MIKRTSLLYYRRKTDPSIPNSVNWVLNGLLLRNSSLTIKLKRLSTKGIVIFKSAKFREERQIFTIAGNFTLINGK